MAQTKRDYLMAQTELKLLEFLDGSLVKLTEKWMEMFLSLTMQQGLCEMRCCAGEIRPFIYMTTVAVAMTSESCFSLWTSELAIFIQ